MLTPVLDFLTLPGIAGTSCNRVSNPTDLGILFATGPSKQAGQHLELLTPETES